MGGGFHWQTEDEDWDEGPLAAGTPTATRHRFPGRLLALLFIVAAAGGAIYWQITHQVNTVNAAVEADLTASVDVIYRARDLNDLELFRTVLSGRDPVWTRAQRDLFNAQLLFDRPEMGLHWRGRKPGERPTIQLAADLTAAEMVSTQRFETITADGVTTTVQLQLTQVYRTGSGRWLLAPPLAEFWGGWQARETPFLRVAYPARDEAVSQRLADDLNTMLAALCAELSELGCAEAPPLHLRFSPDPATFLARKSPEAYLQTEAEELLLPAPTLIGHPIDDAGYAALRRGYARHVALAAAAAWADYECCRHGIYLLAVVDYLLAQQSLAHWPVTQAVFDHLLRLGPSLQEADIAWYARLPEAQYSDFRFSAYAAVSFFLNQPAAVTPARLLGSLNTDDSFHEWLSSTVGGGDRQQLEQAWYVYVLERTTANQPPTALALPTETILLMCATVDGGLGLFHHRPATNSTILVKSVASSGLAQSLPNGDGFLVQSNPNYQVIEYQLLWADESETRILPATGRSAEMYLVASMNGDHDQLVFFHVDRNDDNGDPQQFSYLDLDNCRGQASCRAVAITGIPFWSPSGQQAIVLSPNATGHAIWYRADAGAELELISPAGNSPFWLNENRFGYYDNAGIQLYRRPDETAPFAHESTIEPDELKAAAGLNRIGVLQISAVVARPLFEDTLLILAAESQQNQRFLLNYTVETGDTSIIHVGAGIWHETTLSAQGEYFTLIEQRPETINPRLTVINLSDQFVRQYPHTTIFPGRMSWDAGDEWLLLMPTDTALLFAAPSVHEQALQRLDLDANQSCYSAIWRPSLQ